MSRSAASASPADERPAVWCARGGESCRQCGAAIARDAFVQLDAQNRSACLACAGFADLVYLPSGDVALTRRADRLSGRSVAVLRWNRARHRCERQGLLVEAAALERARLECQRDAELRALRQAGAAKRRERLDREYVDRFATEIRRLFPGIPDDRPGQIAKHACRKYSGRVGRSAAAKDLEPQMIRLAVIANIRHHETAYEEMLAQGQDRRRARQDIQAVIAQTLRQWETPPPAP